MKKILLPILVVIIVVGLCIPMATVLRASTPILVDFETTDLSPGHSVEGLGVVHADLNIQSMGNAALLKENDSTAVAYNAPGGTGNNGCLNGDYGFGDVGKPEYRHYAFTFSPGMAVDEFSILMLDYGDYFPDGGATHTAKLIAYDEACTIVDKDEFSVGTANSIYDACNTDGKVTLEVDGAGIIRVVLQFEGTLDPGVGYDDIAFKPDDTYTPLNQIKVAQVPFPWQFWAVDDAGNVIDRIRISPTWLNPPPGQPAGDGSIFVRRWFQTRPD
ncbi:hypothetical protein ACFLYL_03675, partial [Chloroflexota bacterium]